jgi:hypothetical protein
MLEQSRNDRPSGELEAHGDRSSAESLSELVGPGLDGARAVLEDEPLAIVGAGNPEANVVLLVGPVDADEGGEGRYFSLVHVVTSRTLGVRDMRNRAQRRQYGEPVLRLSLSIRYGQRYTRRRELELVSIACSCLHIRRRRAHVPRSTLSRQGDHGKRNGPPVKRLQLAPTQT